MKSLIKETIKLPVTFSINAEAEQARNELALRGRDITTITTAASNAEAAEVVRDIRAYIKSVETARQTLTKPLLEGQRLLKTLSDDHCAPLLAEQQRIERVAVSFAQAEARRVAEEERKRQEALAKAEEERQEAERVAAAKLAKAEASGSTRDIKAAQKAEQAVIAAETATQNIVMAPPAEVARTKGQQTKKVLCFEVTDINALVKARPDLCKIEAKASAINATCTPDMAKVPPGLRLWYEDKVIFTGGNRPY